MEWQFFVHFDTAIDTCWWVLYKYWSSISTPAYTAFKYHCVEMKGEKAIHMDYHSQCSKFYHIYNIGNNSDLYSATVVSKVDCAEYLKGGRHKE